MKNSLVVFNKNKGPITLSLKPNIGEDQLKEMAQHHKRKVIRSSASHVIIQSNCSVDLCEKTGLSVEEIKNSIEFHQLVKRGILQIMDKVPVQEEIKEEPIPEKIIPVQEIDEIGEIILVQEISKKDISEEKSVSNFVESDEVKPEINRQPPAFAPHRGRPRVTKKEN